MIDFNNKSFFKMKQDSKYREKVQGLLISGEKIIDSYKSMRDGVVFTNKRIISVNVQGITGSKIDYTSIPYSKISAYSIESAGTFDLDCELDIFISGIGIVRFEFKGKTDVEEVSKYISEYIL